MREIKFRAKSAVTGDWVYGFLVPYRDSVSGWAIVGDHYLDKDSGEIYTLEFEEVLHDTIGQFAGITDGLTNQVFEGDIVSTEPKMIGIVRFGAHVPNTAHSEKTARGFYIEWSGPQADVFRKDVGYWFKKRGLAICGNLFDNPDFLEARYDC